MEISLKRKNISSWSIFILVSVLLFFFEIVVCTNFNNSIIIILAIDGFIAISAVAIFYIRDISVYLILLNLLPLIYFNLNFHYLLKWIVVQDIFIYFVIYISFLKFIAIRDKKLENSPFKFPLLMMCGYFFFSAVYGFSRGHAFLPIVDELYHILYYLFALVLAYILEKENYYYILITAVGIVVTMVSLQYIFIFITNGFARIVTFQSNLILFLISISFSFLLLTKRKRLFWLIIFFINVLGLVACQTRTLWVASLLILAIIVFYYFKDRNKKIITKALILGLLLLIPAFVFSGKNVQPSKQLTNNQQLENRATSISDPTQDVSFVMRLELGYYTVQKILNSPIIGSGLGDYVKYKIFNVTNIPIYYIDSSWLYMLWKGGIIGFFLFAWVYIVLLKNSMYIFKHTDELIVKTLSLAIFSGFVGLMLSGIFEASLNKYKYGVVIAVLFAFIDFEKRKLLKKKLIH